MTAEEFIKKHLGKTYKNESDEEVMIVGISENDIIIGRYNNTGWDIVNSYDDIRINSPMIESYNYLWCGELYIVDKLLSL
jgi:hypothetical protein